MKKTRINNITAIIYSVIRYAIILLSDANQKQINTISVLINKIARKTIGYHSYKWSNKNIIDVLAPHNIHKLHLA